MDSKRKIVFLYLVDWTFGKKDPINENFIPESLEELIIIYKNINQKTLQHKFKIMLSSIFSFISKS